MRQSAIHARHSSVADTVGSFERHLRAENKSPSTVATYCKAVAQLDGFLRARDLPTDVAEIRREHLEAFLVDLQGRTRPATVAQRYRSLQQFWKWLVSEEEIPESPMARMRAPIVPVEPPPLLTDDEMRRLLVTAVGTGFDDRRDAAILRLLADTGMRRGELAGLRLEDIDFGPDVAVVMGKGRRPRACPFGRRTAQAIDRYLRARARHEYADLPWLWLGKRGQLKDNGILQMVRRRGERAGIEHVYVHLFRHGFANAMLADGVQEGDLMQLAGWKSRQMLGRYGAAQAASRARTAYRSHSPVDKL